MSFEDEYCLRCKNLTEHEVELTVNVSGAPWRRGRCLICNGCRALPIGVEDRKSLGLEKRSFYKTNRWLRLRYETFEEQGVVCAVCGARPPGIEMHIDHIKPRSKFPELEYDKTNLQVLCHDCNIGKGAIHKETK